MTAYISPGLASIACLLSASIFYLGCPNQQWLPKRPLRFYPAFTLSLLLLTLSAWLFTHTLSLLSTLFATLYLWVLCLGGLPFFSPLNKPSNASGKDRKTISKSKTGSPYEPGWRLKILTGLLLGLPLALGLAGLFAWWGPGQLLNPNKVQLTMWLVTPVWLTLLSLMFLGTSGKRLLLGCCGMNVVVYTLLWVAKSGS